VTARRSVAVLIAALVLASLRASPARAADQRATFLERASLEWVLGFASWRSSILPNDVAPGFSVLGGGSELLLGIDLVAGVGLVADGRIFAGPRMSGVYVEGLAGVGPQLRVSDSVRLRVGAAGGQARLDRKGMATHYSPLVGGFFAASVDLVHLGRGRVAAVAMLRIDVDAQPGAEVGFPHESLSISTGLGFRF
jgi:hypothetical protein